MLRAPIVKPAAKPGTMELSTNARSPAITAQAETFTRASLEDIRKVSASRPTDASFKPILPCQLVYVPEAGGYPEDQKYYGEPWLRVEILVQVYACNETDEGRDHHGDAH